MKLFLFALFATLLLPASIVSAAPPEQGKAPAVHSVALPRAHLSLDQGWKFHLGDDWPGAFELRLSKAGMNQYAAGVTFDDVLWRTVNLPHDWVVELPFDEKSDRNHGFKPVGPGFQQNNIGWYRREFEISASDAGKRIGLQFDGIYRDAHVFVNGWEMIHHESGYSPFRTDITDVVHSGKNTLAVRVDASEFEGWFYEGAGIYRHVWLDKTDPVAIAPDGVFVTSAFEGNGHTVPNGPAAITASVTVTNTGTNSITTTVGGSVAPTGGGERTALVSEKGAIAAGEARTFILKGSVSKPRLWSPETPSLYLLSNTVSIEERVTDQLTTTFGIRTVAFDKDLGFLLNGKPYPIYGTCNHQDHAGVGAALPDALQEFRVQKLKEFSNAYRCSHNPPTPELLDACDRLGMLVMDENRLLGSSEQNLDLLRTLVLRDRNHPSVFIWSLCNEEYIQNEPVSGRVATSMQRLVKQLDPTRPVTAAANVSGNIGIPPSTEVRGWNYQEAAWIDTYRKNHPNQPHVGTEDASYMTTRGEYVYDNKKGFVDCYDGRAPATPEKWWGQIFLPRPWLSGGFIWTGFDYRGEPTPFSWPCISSHFGVIDTCGFPKDNWWYYRAWWGKAPVLHIYPHWNWAGKEGQEIRVDALANCHEVELFLNGTSFGRQQAKPDAKMTWKVKYAPGTLSAKGYNAVGKVVSETKVETTGAPAALHLEAWRPSLPAQPWSAAVVNISGVDDKGRVVPIAMDEVSFSITGPAKILGVGNGNPSCHEPDQFLSVPTVRSISVTNWRGKAMKLPPKKNSHRDPSSPDLEKFVATLNDSAWTGANADGSFPIPPGKPGVCAATLSVTAEDLKANALLLKVNGGGFHPYVNGKPLDIKLSLNGDIPALGQGECVHVPASMLHPGVNRITVAFESAPKKPEASLALVNDGPMHWTRSLFNGYAQVILSSTGEPGNVTLTASARGLQSAAVMLKAEPSSVPPSLP